MLISTARVSGFAQKRIASTFIEFLSQVLVDKLCYGVAMGWIYATGTQYDCVEGPCGCEDARLAS